MIAGADLYRSGCWGGNFSSSYILINRQCIICMCSSSPGGHKLSSQHLPHFFIICVAKLNKMWVYGVEKRKTKKTPNLNKQSIPPPQKKTLKKTKTKQKTTTTPLYFKSFGRCRGIDIDKYGFKACRVSRNQFLRWYCSLVCSLNSVDEAYNLTLSNKTFQP